MYHLTMTSTAHPWHIPSSSDMHSQSTMCTTHSQPWCKRWWPGKTLVWLQCHEFNNESQMMWIWPPRHGFDNYDADLTTRMQIWPPWRGFDNHDVNSTTTDMSSMTSMTMMQIWQPQIQVQQRQWPWCRFDNYRYKFNNNRDTMLKYRKVTRSGIEPRTFWTYTRCSNQLSYLALEFNQLILYLCNCQPKDTYSARHI